MRFRMSANVAVRTKVMPQAVDFYTKIFGFENRSENPEVADLDANPLTLYIIEDQEISGPVMELFVDDLEKAKEILVENGCRVVRWRGKGQDSYIEDPFGVIFNLWEE
jgi:predicted enzyme related to lactoylglutathione lyase